MLNGKVMVTGGASYIGSHAVLALLDARYDVVVVDNLITGFDWAVDRRAMLVEAIVADDAKVRAAIREHNVKAIMHFAGSVVVPESVSDPLKYYRNNTAASRALIESAVVEGVQHFIFSSTAATYGTPDKVPTAEGDPTLPINPYGMSKLMTEAMLRDVAAAHPMNYAALRYFNVAGADPKGRSGQSTVGATHLIKIAVEAATGKRSHVGVYGTDFDTPDGTDVRDYIHVNDVAAAHVAGGFGRRPCQESHAQRRVRQGLLGARGSRRGRQGYEHDDRPPPGRASRGRSGDADLGQSRYPGITRLDAPPRRPRRHRARRACLGTQIR
jgi:UDP-glucose 4-epimerase